MAALWLERGVGEGKGGKGDEGGRKKGQRGKGEETVRPKAMARLPRSSGKQRKSRVKTQTKWL